MSGIGRLQLHGICSYKLVYREVVEARSNYKRSYFCYFQGFGNIICGDLTGVIWIEKDYVRLPPDLAWEKGEKWRWDLVHVECL